MKTAAANPPLDAVIVGAPKAGTTSLYHYLSEHPEIQNHGDPELVFFIDDARYELGWDKVFPDRYGTNDPSRLLLAKNAGLITDRVALERLRAHSPDARVILMFREPVARAYSAYWFARRHCIEPLPTFEAALRAPADRFPPRSPAARWCAYVENSIYVKQARMLMSIFPREQITFLVFRDFLGRKLSVSRSIWKKLGLSADVAPDLDHRYNEAAAPRWPLLTRLLSSQNPLKKRIARALPNVVTRDLGGAVRRLNERPFEPPPIDPSTREELQLLFTPYNEQLAELTGLNLDSWSTRS